MSTTIIATVPRSPSAAAQEDMKKAFRKLALKLHPDKNPGDEVSLLQDSVRHSNYCQGPLP